RTPRPPLPPPLFPYTTLFRSAIASLGRAAWPVEVTGVVAYLAFINLLLAGFNLLPAFPLDGGRIFRALLWKWKGDWRWATRVAADRKSTRLNSSHQIISYAVF